MLGLAWCAHFRNWLLTDGVPTYRDLLHTYLPLRAYWAQRVREGHLPQWYPYEGLGEPFIGQLVDGTFHPVHLLYLVFSLVAALKMEIALGIAVGLVGAYRLLRSFESGRTASVVGAYVYGLAGYIISLESNLPYLLGAAALPWVVLWGTRLTGDRGGGRHLVGCAVAWALMLLGGDLQTFILAGAVLVAVTLASPRIARRGTIRLVAVGVLAAGLAGAALLPAWAARRGSVREDFNKVEGSHARYALALDRVPEFVLARPSPEVRRQQDQPEPWSPSLFVGSLAVVLAVVGAVRGSKRERAFAVVGGLAFWTALGPGAGLYSVLHTLPLLESLRYPEKYLIVTTLAVSCLCARGVDILLAEPRGRGHRMVLAAGFVLGVIGVVFLTMSHATESASAGLYREWASSSWMGAVFLAAGYLAAQVASGAPLAAVVAIQLVVGNDGVVPLVARTLIEETPVFCAAARAAGAGVGRGRVRGAVAPADVDPLAEPAEWTALSTNLLLPDEAGLCSIESAFSLYDNLPATSRRWRFLVDGKQENADHLAPLFNVPLAIVARPAGVNERVIASLPGTAFNLVSRVTMPRAYVGVPRPTGRLSDVLRALRADPDLAGIAPLVEGPGTTPSDLSSPGSVHLVTDEPEHVEMDVEMTRPGLVVLNDAWAPGWTAMIDQEDAKVIPANLVARGVPVLAGRHHIDMRYESPMLREGTVASLLSLVVLLGLALRGWPVRREGL